ncbi:MAG: carbon-nitrogen hydrolase family protein [Bdellovibrio sp.]
MAKIKIGVIQLTSQLDYKVNLEKISSFLEKASQESAKYIFLPECFYSMSDGTKPSPHLINGMDEHYANIQNLAKKYQVYLLAGSAAIKEGDKVKNRAYNFAPDGTDLGQYDKIHLFSCDIMRKGEEKRINEADIYTPGQTPQLIQAGPFNIGLGICFDLRFPEQSRDYTMKGANLLTYSSAFTVPTGRAHWHTLLRARAIENQLFVVAPAQWGVHNQRIITYGHSLVIDPWGEVLVDAGEGEKIVFAELDLERVNEVRRSVHCLDL